MFFASPAYYVEFIVVIFVFLNYILNPLLCVIFNKDFRRGVKKSLGLRRKQLVRQALQAFVSTVSKPKTENSIEELQNLPVNLSPSLSPTNSSYKKSRIKDPTIPLNPYDLFTARRGSVNIPISRAYAEVVEEGDDALSEV